MLQCSGAQGCEIAFYWSHNNIRDTNNSFYFIVLQTWDHDKDRRDMVILFPNISNYTSDDAVINDHVVKVKLKLQKFYKMLADYPINWNIFHLNWWENISCQIAKILFIAKIHFILFFLTKKPASDHHVKWSTVEC